MGSWEHHFHVICKKESRITESGGKIIYIKHQNDTGRCSICDFGTWNPVDQFSVPNKIKTNVLIWQKLYDDIIEKLISPQ